MMKLSPLSFLFSLWIIALATPAVSAALQIAAPFDDGAVLQRDMPLPIWGWAEKGSEVQLSLAGQSARATTDENGYWRVTLDPLPAGGPFPLNVTTPDATIEHLVWVGEVWMAAGQSNMQWTIRRSRNFDLFQAIEDHPEIRVLRITTPGTQQPQNNIVASWQPVNSQTIANISSIAFHYAKVLQQKLGVPIGIIDNSWGGSSAEAWVDRELVKNNEVLKSIHENWVKEEEKLLAEEPESNRLTGQHRPANIYNARVYPLIPMAFRGVIWYQGESNASRAEQYLTLFPALIESWRETWGIGDFPFYWVQLAAYRDVSHSGPDSHWPQLRDAQTQTMRLPNTGQAVIIDTGDTEDIHPWGKEEVGRRLARWALANDYGVKNVHYRSPQISAWQQQEQSILVQFEYTGSGLMPLNGRHSKNVQGFAVAGENREWIPVEGTLLDNDQVALALPEGLQVQAIRYAWAINPVVNLVTKEGLPVTPYRSDNWPWISN